MEFWIRVWATVLGVSLSGFALLALVVTVGGWRDLRQMLADFKRRTDA